MLTGRRQIDKGIKALHIKVDPALEQLLGRNLKTQPLNKLSDKLTGSYGALVSLC